MSLIRCSVSYKLDVIFCSNELYVSSNVEVIKDDNVFLSWVKFMLLLLVVWGCGLMFWLLIYVFWFLCFCWDNLGNVLWVKGLFVIEVGNCFFVLVVIYWLLSWSGISSCSWGMLSISLSIPSSSGDGI